MTDFELMVILCTSSIIICCICVIGLMSLNRKLATGLHLVSFCLHHIIINKGVVKYETTIPGMAKDTEMAE